VCTQKEIGEISDSQRFREAYLGAIYRHFGVLYRVIGYGENNTISVDLLPESDGDVVTEPVFWWHSSISELLRGERYGSAFECVYGKIDLYENFSGFKVIDRTTGQVRSEEERRESKVYRGVRAYWITLFEIPDGWEGGGIHSPRRPIDAIDLGVATGLEQMIRIGASFVVPCDRFDISTYSDDGEKRIVLYECIEGGIGIAEKVLERWRDVLKQGMRVAENCKCSDGCPACIISPFRSARSNNCAPKHEILNVAERILKHAEVGVTSYFDPNLHQWIETIEGGN
jgi:DEAD/DEAH box helicase domain-containing protein